MKHARTDYQGRIVDLDGTIPADEPVFVLRASDPLFEETLRYWASAYTAHRDADAHTAQMVLEHADAGVQYRKDHDINKLIADVPRTAIPDLQFPPTGRQMSEIIAAEEG